MLHQEKQTRVEIVQQLAKMTKIKRKEVEALFDNLLGIIASHMSPEGSGEIIIPKIGVKIKRIKRKATKSRTMVSPLTGTEVDIASKPERFDVKLYSLKPLKEALGHEE